MMDSRRIIADIRQMTASISKAETTARPEAALKLQEARRHLLRASMAVEWAVERNDLIGGIVTDASFERSQLARVTISVPNGRRYDLMVDDGVLVCPRVI